MSIDKLGQILENQKLFMYAFEHAAIGMALVAPGGQWLMVNHSLCQLLGYKEEELLTLTFQEITHPDDLEIDRLYIQDLLIGKRDSYQKEKRYIHKNGNVVYALLSVSLVRNSEDSPLFLISQIQDITERKNLENELVKQAREDVLTGASNRRCFYERSTQELLRLGRYGEPAVLLMLDIDHFKNINDTFGHAAGDEALVEMTSTCVGLLRPFDLLGRIGGEEFAVLLIKTDAMLGKTVAERLRKAVENISISTPRGEINFTVSVGGVAFIGQDQKVDQLVRQADDALYEAKAAGRNTVKIIDDKSVLLARKQAGNQAFIKLVWQEAFSCGHEVIDQQHKALFRVANALLSAFTVSAKDKNNLPLIETMISDVSEHFRAEEKLLSDIRYPHALEHGKKHAELLSKAKTLSRKYREGKLNVHELLKYLALDVVYDHLLEEDQKFFPHI